MNTPSIHWFRLDLRLGDNPTLRAALERGGAVVPVFIWSPDEEAPWQPGGPSRWWLHQSLAALDGQLPVLGSRLVIRRGPALETLRALVKETGAEAVFWNRRYEPAIIARDGRVKVALCGEGLAVESFNAALLHEPWTIQNQSGKPFQVFTPFWRHCLAQPDPPEPLPAPKHPSSRREKAMASWLRPGRTGRRPEAIACRQAMPAGLTLDGNNYLTYQLYISVSIEDDTCA